MESDHPIRAAARMGQVGLRLKRMRARAVRQAMRMEEAAPGPERIGGMRKKSVTAMRATTAALTAVRAPRAAGFWRMRGRSGPRRAIRMKLGRKMAVVAR